MPLPFLETGVVLEQEEQEEGKDMPIFKTGNRFELHGFDPFPVFVPNSSNGAELWKS